MSNDVDVNACIDDRLLAISISTGIDIGLVLEEFTRRENRLVQAYYNKDNGFDYDKCRVNALLGTEKYFYEDKEVKKE